MVVNPCISMPLLFSAFPYFPLTTNLSNPPWNLFCRIPKPIFTHSRTGALGLGLTVVWLHGKSQTTHSLLSLEWPLLEFITGEWRKTVSSPEVFYVVFPPLERPYHQSVPSGFHQVGEIRPFLDTDLTVIQYLIFYFHKKTFIIIYYV